MKDDTPILQIVHVSDIHFKHKAASADHALNGRRRCFARLFHRMVEAFDLFGWHDGTQGAYPKAPESFRRFLKDWRARDDRWYGAAGDADSAQTWLVDTGDLSVFGDDASLQGGQEHLASWRAELGGCALRTLFGNHDAWPGMLPIYALLGFSPSEIDRQRARLAGYPEWNQSRWLAAPLSIAIPGTEAFGGSSIELYALNSVCWRAIANTLAVGNIDDADLATYVDGLRNQAAAQPTQRNLRIIAMHHPLVFPYTHSESHALGVLPVKVLLAADDRARKLRNDANDPKGLGVLAHLFLSGHAHASFPAGALPDSVTAIRQGELASWQLQLVGGPLMQNRADDAASRSSVPTAPSDRGSEQFVPGLLDPHNCQAQILRFSSHPERGKLTMTRIPVRSVNGSVYEVDPKTTSVTTLSYATQQPGGAAS